MKKYCLFLLILLIQKAAGAEARHFISISNTGGNMIVLVQASITPTINGEPLETGDEIGVFDENGLCVGASTWDKRNDAITVWGDDDQTAAVDGIKENDTLHFRIWDKSESRELTSAVTFDNESQCTYEANKIAILQTLTGNVDLRNYRIRKTIPIREPALSIFYFGQ
jgi:hypothetical protein